MSKGKNLCGRSWQKLPITTACTSNAINKDGLLGAGPFGWQDGYAAYTVSPSKVPDVIQYIANQREYHRKQTFEATIRNTSGIERSLRDVAHRLIVFRALKRPANMNSRSATDATRVGGSDGYYRAIEQ